MQNLEVLFPSFSDLFFGESYISGWVGVVGVGGCRDNKRVSRVGAGKYFWYGIGILRFPKRWFLCAYGEWLVGIGCVGKGHDILAVWWWCQVKGAPGEWGSKYLCPLVRDTGI